MIRFSIVVLIIALALALDGADNASSLKILVPLKKGFEEFVRWEASATPVTGNTVVNFSGFAIDVFRECIKRLDYPINYTLVAFGDGITDPSYNDLVQKLITREADGVVADLTITSKRLDQVDLSQPYLPSRLDMVVPLRQKQISGFFGFASPFSWDLWVAILGAFLLTILFTSFFEPFEREQLQWYRRLGKAFWFTCATVTSTIGMEVKSLMVKIWTVVWLLLVLTVKGGYTANLTSIILSQQRSVPTIASFQDLQRSQEPIGCQEGSFTIDFLTETLGISSDRLVNLITQQDYDNAFKSGRVAAIVDESPYLETFLTDLGCSYKRADSNIAYFGGFAFAFQKNSSLTRNVSLSILSLAQTGDLQRLKDKWLGSGQCAIDDAPDILSFNDLWGLFVLAAAFTVGLWVVYGVYYICIICSCLHQRRR